MPERSFSAVHIMVSTEVHLMPTRLSTSVNTGPTSTAYFMRHVLEHNVEWRRILAGAIASFRKRMALIIFTPFAETTRVMSTALHCTSVSVPDLSFRKEDLTQCFDDLRYTEESLKTDTQYGVEHIFYIEK